MILHTDFNSTSELVIPPRSDRLKEQAASDAEVETRKNALGPVKAALARLGERDEATRPDTAPSGPVTDADLDTKRRSAQVMHDFFKETNMREKLQEQCDDLNREVDKLQAERMNLKQQLLDAQAAITEKDKAIAAAAKSSGTDQSAHTTLVDEMEKNFASETKTLEEEKQKSSPLKRRRQKRLSVRQSSTRC
jgi:predicted RNase H-like nuclease (RuvC/YqgF family)